MHSIMISRNLFLNIQIASEDSEPRDSSHDDCTVDVLQYKSDSESE